mmetsp:Transcript_32609/g.75186  ORF Transcript_32609/g.75186 Transcript_32609/m.75186 type:complete len:216 (-) Transcript_32609:1417-2064(-)
MSLRGTSDAYAYGLQVTQKKKKTYLGLRTIRGERAGGEVLRLRLGVPLTLALYAASIAFGHLIVLRHERRRRRRLLAPRLSLGQLLESAFFLAFVRVLDRIQVHLRCALTEHASVHVLAASHPANKARKVCVEQFLVAALQLLHSRHLKQRVGCGECAQIQLFELEHILELVLAIRAHMRNERVDRLIQESTVAHERTLRVSYGRRCFFRARPRL